MRRELSRGRDPVRSGLSGKFEKVSGCERYGRSFGYAFRTKPRKTTLRMTVYSRYDSVSGVARC